MKNSDGVVLYVGKAKCLKKRLASYLRAGDAGKTGALLSRVSSIDTVVTNTEKEALLLEASLIKKHRPKYNVILRDDKNYPLIKVTVQESWPRVMMSRRRKKDGARYFGPFSSSSAMWETLNHLNHLFPLRRCKDRNPLKRQRPCLNYQMGRCLAPCAGLADREQYMANVRNVMMALDGRNQAMNSELTASMQEASAALNFEQAARFRDLIRALAETFEKQVVVASHFDDQDIFGFIRYQASVAVSLVRVTNGVISGHQSYFLPEPWGEDAEVLVQVLERFYEQEESIPAVILLPFLPADSEVLVEWLEEKRSRKVAVSIPRRGQKLELLNMAMANARKMLAAQECKEQSWQVLAAKLVICLRLSRQPLRVECLDISNFGGEQPVGALTSFLRGEKDAGNYRHYHIKTVSGPDDYAMMAEVLDRRFRDIGPTSDLPDLLVVDGGRGQLNIARRVLSEKGLLEKVELAGIAKDKDGQGDKIWRPGRKNSLLLKRNSPVLLFLMQIRDETHRYGITFHRKLRQRQTLSSELDFIPGIGPARRNMLLREIGSLRKIKQASLEELAAVKNIGPELARIIYNHFHS